MIYVLSLSSTLLRWSEFVFSSLWPIAEVTLLLSMSNLHILTLSLLAVTLQCSILDAFTKISLVLVNERSISMRTDRSEKINTFMYYFVVSICCYLWFHRGRLVAWLLRGTSEIDVQMLRKASIYGSFLRYFGINYVQHISVGKENEDSEVLTVILNNLSETY